MPNERLARSGLISLFGSAFAAFAALALTSIVGNFLGAEGTGVFFQAVGIFTILTQVFRLGTNSGIVRFIAEQRAFDRIGAEWRIVLFATVPVAVLSGAVSVALWVFSDTAAAWLAAPTDRLALAELLRAMSPFIVVGALIGVFQIASRMLRGVATFTMLQSVLLPASRLLAVIVISIGTVSAWSAFEAWLWPLPFWLLVTAAVIAAPMLRDFRRRRLSHVDERPTFRRFWRFNAPRAVNSGLEAALEWADVIIVAAVASPAVAGVYAVTTRAVRAGGIVDKAMRVAVSPTTSALLARGQTEDSSQLHTRVVRAMILLNWPFYLLLISMGGSVLLIFGPEFVAGWGPMVLLAAAAMFQTAAGMLQSILLQGGKSTWQMYNKSLAVAISIGGNLLLVPLLGIWGAALTWVVVMVTDNLLAAHQVHSRMNVHLQPRRLLLPAFLSTVVWGFGGAIFSWVGGVSFLTLLAALALLGLLYTVALWLLRRHLEIASLWRRVPVIGRFA